MLIEGGGGVVLQLQQILECMYRDRVILISIFASL